MLSLAVVTGIDGSLKRRNEVVLAACALGVALACSPESAFLGSVGEQPPTHDVPVEFSCDEQLCFIDPSLDADEVKALFDEAGFSGPARTAPAPTWIYPLSESVHPSNLGLLSLHFVRSAEEQEVFEVVVSSEERARKLYFPCLSAGDDGCAYKVPEDFWTSAATEFAGQTVDLVVRGASPGVLTERARLSIEFSPDPVEAGLYYWSSELRGMYRLVFGGRQAVPYVSPGTSANPGACAGCHAVSRDGRTIAYTVGSAEDGEVFDNAAFNGSLTVAPITALNTPKIDPESPTPLGSGMLTLSTDGSRVVSAFDFKLELRDTESGALLAETTTLDERIPFFPEFSPDDQSLVVTLTNQIDTEIAVRGGGIYVVSVAGDTFGAVTELVPESPGESHYYPSWSPDGRWVAFVTSPAGVKSYDQPQGRLRLVSVETGETFDLKNASGPTDSTSTWPKFAPGHQCPNGGLACSDSSIFFLSYSSKRAYGLLANQPGEYARSQLWMSALFMDKTLEGEEPSTAPFWVPYQDTNTSNHLGYWTETLFCNDTYGCGPDQACTNGQCVARPR